MILSHGSVAWFHPPSCWFRWELRMQQPWFEIQRGYGPGVDLTSFWCNYVMESIKVVPVSKSWFSLFEIYHFGRGLDQLAVKHPKVWGFSQFQTSQTLPNHNKLRNPNVLGGQSFLIFRPATVRPCLQPWVRWLRMWEFWSQAHLARLDVPAMTRRKNPTVGRPTSTTTHKEFLFIMLIMISRYTVCSLAVFFRTNWSNCLVELLVFQTAFSQGFGIHQPTAERAHQPATQTVEPRELASVHWVCLKIWYIYI